MIRDDLSTRLPDGRRIAWAEIGDPDGLVVVHLHGTPGGRLGRRGDDERYVREGLRVIAPDRAGYGRSDAVRGRTVLDASRDVVALLEHLGVDQTVVIGGSGGGPHALGVALVAPETVRAVGVLVGAAPLTDADVALMPQVNRTIHGALAAPDELEELLRTVRTALLEQGLATVLADAPAGDRERWESQAEVVRTVLTDALAPGVEGMRDDYLALWATPWEFAPEDVPAPVVWRHGREDPAVPIRAAEACAARLPSCRFVTVDGGHAPGPGDLAELEAAVLAAGIGAGVTSAGAPRGRSSRSA